MPGPGVAGHWGYSGSVKNPDNSSGSDYCAVATWAMRYGTPSTWGYNDIDCTRTFVSMCKLRSEQRGSWLMDEAGLQWWRQGCADVPCQAVAGAAGCQVLQGWHWVLLPWRPCCAVYMACQEGCVRAGLACQCWGSCGTAPTAVPRSHQHLFVPRAPADPNDFGAVQYTTVGSRYTFTFNIDYKSQKDAETSCQAQGAHLAVYVSEEEQAEVGLGRGGASHTGAGRGAGCGSGTYCVVHSMLARCTARHLLQ